MRPFEPLSSSAPNVGLSQSGWPPDDAGFLATLACDDGLSRTLPVYALLTARAVYDVVFDISIVPDLRTFLTISQKNAEHCTKSLVSTVLKRSRHLEGIAADSCRKISDIAEAHNVESCCAISSLGWRRMRRDAMAMADATPTMIDKIALEVASALAWPTSTAAQSVHETIRLLVEAEAEFAAQDSGMARVAAAEIFRLNRQFRSEVEPKTSNSSPFWSWLAEVEPRLVRDYEAQEAFLRAQRLTSTSSLLAQTCAYRQHHS